MKRFAACCSNIHLCRLANGIPSVPQRAQDGRQLRIEYRARRRSSDCLLPQHPISHPIIDDCRCIRLGKSHLRYVYLLKYDL